MLVCKGKKSEPGAVYPVEVAVVVGVPRHEPVATDLVVGLEPPDFAVPDADEVGETVAGHVGEEDGLQRVGEDDGGPTFLVDPS